MTSWVHAVSDILMERIIRPSLKPPPPPPDSLPLATSQVSGRSASGGQPHSGIADQEDLNKRPFSQCDVTLLPPPTPVGTALAASRLASPVPSLPPHHHHANTLVKLGFHITLAKTLIDLHLHVHLHSLTTAEQVHVRQCQQANIARQLAIPAQQADVHSLKTC